MANTTNYNWETPDDTDLVKDGAAAIRTLGNSIDTTTKNLNPETTTGDIAYRSATANTNTRLAIGTTGQVLTVAAGVPSWATPTVGDITEVQAGVGISVASGTGPIPIITNSSTDLITTAGDLLYGTAADTVARLGIGTAGQVLKVNSGATAPEWGAASSTPTFIGVSVGKSAGQSVANTTYTAITFDLEDFDTDAFHSTSTNTSRITIPAGKAGKYLFTGLVSFAANVTGMRTMQLTKNGTAVNTVTRQQAVVGGDLTMMPFSYVASAAVSDYFEMSLYQNSGVSLDCRVETVFQATYLGA